MATNGRPGTETVGGYVDLDFGGPETSTKQRKPTVAHHELPWRQNDGGYTWYIPLNKCQRHCPYINLRTLQYYHLTIPWYT
jgi:hypothetical protein